MLTTVDLDACEVDALKSKRPRDIDTAPDAPRVPAPLALHATLQYVRLSYNVKYILLYYRGRGRSREPPAQRKYAPIDAVHLRADRGYDGAVWVRL